MDEIHILPPAGKACRVCGAMHDPDRPHDVNSLYYKVQFYKRNKRFPTAEDAAAHCAKEDEDGKRMEQH